MHAEQQVSSACRHYIMLAQLCEGLNLKHTQGASICTPLDCQCELEHRPVPAAGRLQTYPGQGMGLPLRAAAVPFRGVVAPSGAICQVVNTCWAHNFVASGHQQLELFAGKANRGVDLLTVSGGSKDFPV